MTNPIDGPQEAKPIRVGIFESYAKAEKAVDELLRCGFTEAEVTVFCPSDKCPQHLEEERGPDTGLPVQNLVGGSLLGGTLGGLLAIAGLATTGGVPILVAGGMAGLLSGGVVGGLVGVMVHRGVEKEPADYFDQAVAQGLILVAVEPIDQDRLDEASQTLNRAGAQPVPLREG